MEPTRVHDQGRRGDSTRFLGEFPERVVNPAQVLVREPQRLAVIKSERDRPPGRRGSRTNRIFRQTLLAELRRLDL